MSEVPSTIIRIFGFPSDWSMETVLINFSNFGEIEEVTTVQSEYGEEDFLVTFERLGSAIKAFDEYQDESNSLGTSVVYFHANFEKLEGYSGRPDPESKEVKPPVVRHHCSNENCTSTMISNESITAPLFCSMDCYKDVTLSKNVTSLHERRRWIHEGGNEWMNDMDKLSITTLGNRRRVQIVEEDEDENNVV